MDLQKELEKAFHEMSDDDKAKLGLFTMRAKAGAPEDFLSEQLKQLPVSVQKYLSLSIIDGMQNKIIDDKLQEAKRLTKPVKRDAVTILCALIQSPAIGVSISLDDATQKAIAFAQQIHDHF